MSDSWFKQSFITFNASKTKSVSIIFYEQTNMKFQDTRIYGSADT